jgi:hypothetical protein
MLLKFINYVHDPARESPINLAMARIVLTIYLLWKVVWYDWTAILAIPVLSLGRRR